MNTQNFNQTSKTNFVKRAFAAAAVISVMLTDAPAASAMSTPRNATCGMNPAEHGWVPVQVTMEYEARCGKKAGCALNPATQGWVPVQVQVSMEYEARCK